MTDASSPTAKPYGRRALLSAAAAIGVPAALSLTTRPAHAQITTDHPNLIPVGPSRTCRTIHEALDSILDASSNNRYAIMLDPGLHDLTGYGQPAFLKPFVSLVGTDQQSTVIATDSLSNIHANSNCRIERVTILYQGQTATGGAIENRVRDVADFSVSDCFIFVNGPGAGISSGQYIKRAEIKSLTILTAAGGIALRGGGNITIHDINIHLTGSGGPHIGILTQNYARVHVFGGRIGTGYGYEPVNDTSQPVIGVQCTSTSFGRIHLHDVWSICRNDGASPAVPVNCVRVEGAQGWVRIFGGYFQAENPSGGYTAQTFANSGGGRIEVYAARARDYGEGSIYGSTQIGRSLVTAADDGRVLDQGMSGLVLLDAAAGPFRIYLPRVPTETSQFIFKKVDPTLNPVTIDGNQRLIDGMTGVTLDTPYAKLHLRCAYEQYHIVG